MPDRPPRPNRPPHPPRPSRPPNPQAYELILPRDHKGALVIEPLEPRLTDAEVVSRLETEMQRVVEATGGGGGGGGVGAGGVGGGSRVVIDFRNVQFLSSAVLGVIVGLGILIRDNGGNLALANVAPNLHKVFSITSLDKMIRIYPSTDEAIAALS